MVHKRALMFSRRVIVLASFPGPPLLTSNASKTECWVGALAWERGYFGSGWHGNEAILGVGGMARFETRSCSTADQ